jgi:hypothetical protein
VQDEQRRKDEHSNDPDGSIAEPNQQADSTCDEVNMAPELERSKSSWNMHDLTNVSSISIQISLPFGKFCATIYNAWRCVLIC